MYAPEPLYPRSSFNEPLSDPLTEPDAAPLVCIQVNQSWIPILAGCVKQLMQPLAWAAVSQANLYDLLDRSFKLMCMIGLAGACVFNEFGQVSVTIGIGNATNTATVTFTLTYTTPPTILVSCDNLQCTATFSDVTTTGCTLTLAVSVPTNAPVSGLITWAALV